MRGILLLVIFLAAAAILAHRMAGWHIPASSASAQNNVRPKKIIEWGWDYPTSTWLRDNIEKAEAMPFDGVVLALRTRDGRNSSMQMWSANRIDYNALAYMAEDMAGTPFKRLTDRFIQANIEPGNVNWSDDDAWAGVLHNYALAARIAKAGGCKGFIFDTEQYETAPLSEAYVNASSDAEREFFHQLIRQRGRELMSVIAREFPDIVIIIPHAYYSSSQEPKIYAYLPDLLDGMFEAAPIATKLLDGWEHSYGYKGGMKEYTWAHQELKGSSKFSVVPELVRRKMGPALEFGWIAPTPVKSGARPIFPPTILLLRISK